MDEKHEEPKPSCNCGEASHDAETQKDSGSYINVDLTKAQAPFRRYKLTPEELTLIKKGIENLPKEVIKHFNEAYLSLMSKFGNTDYFIVMYTSGIKSRRKTRNNKDKERANT
jgi:hypothetical protein